jgi:two-component system sensor histidine kinase VanS
LSVRLKLTLSYAGFLMVAGAVLLVAGYFSLSRGFHPGVTFMVRRHSDLVDSFAPTAVLVMLFLLLFGLGGGWWLAGRMLAPLPRITDATRKAATGSLSHRIELDGPNDEFRELADAFDGMLARLEAHVAEQQRFAANASHELRTPLAVTKTLLDVAARDPDRDTRDILHRLAVVNTRAIDLTEALLLLSRAGRGALDLEPVDLSLVVEEAAETLLPLATKRGVTVETSGDVAHTTGSPALLLQMATNLLHNAIVHNLPESGSVCISTHARPAGVQLLVENTGQPLDPEIVSTLAEPFRRGTERIQSDDSGAGLGLAIVDRIVRAHRGTLSLEARPSGGLIVTARLPPATPLTSDDARVMRAPTATSSPAPY